MTDEVNYGIQTRYYRAPEIILHHTFNETCDVWSMGCMIFELLTNEILIDPDKNNKLSNNINVL